MLKQDYERFNTLIPDEIFQMACDEETSSTCEMSSKEANASIKRFMKENKINKTMFGQMIGIKKGSTARGKINGQSRFTSAELARISELTHIDMETLERENPTPDVKRDLPYIGERTETSKQLRIRNNSNRSITQIKIRLCNNHIRLRMMEDDEVIPAGKEYIMEYEPEWGSHIDMSVEFDGGEKTVVEGFCLTTHNWISFDKYCDWNSTTGGTTYLLLKRDPDFGGYINVMPMDRCEADIFIHKFGDVPKSQNLTAFLATSTGEVNGGEYCIIENA